MYYTKYRYAFMALIAVYSYANTVFAEVYRYYHIAVPAYAVLIAFAIVTVGVWEGSRVIQNGLLRKLETKDPYRHLLIFFLTSLCWSAGVSAAVFLIAGRLVYHMSGDQLAITIKLGLTLGTRINLFLQVVNIIFFFFRRYRHKELEAEELRRINAQAQLQAIKNQVNPHFLFNNLNVLSTLVMQEKPEANQFIEEFSLVYRHVLNSQQQELVTVREELEFMQHYIFLLGHRFPDSILIDIRIPPSYNDYYIVPVALQMLVENAIKHNVVSSSQPLRIDIFVNEDEQLVCRNNLQPKTAVEGSTRIGLNNIDQRYFLISQQNILINRTEDIFSVALPLIKTVP